MSHCTGRLVYGIPFTSANPSEVFSYFTNLPSNKVCLRFRGDATTFYPDTMLLYVYNSEKYIESSNFIPLNKPLEIDPFWKTQLLSFAEKLGIPQIEPCWLFFLEITDY